MASQVTGQRGMGVRTVARVEKERRGDGVGKRVGVSAVLLALLVALGCGDSEPAKAPAAKTPAPAAATPAATPTAPAAPDNLDLALVLSLAQFVNEEQEGGKSRPVPGAARLEFLVRKDGEWTMSALEDPDSNVFHKGMALEAPDGRVDIVTAGGSGAYMKLWTAGEGGLQPKTLWTKEFGGKFSRMRDVEVADLFGDGGQSMAVATHDQGIVAVIRRNGEEFSVEEIDQEPDTFVHEIEIGDVDGDGALEVYSTPSEPNRLDGSVQTGQVNRYVPAKGEGRVVVADLEDRHAKEILVHDVDQNGKDELYVVVEGHTEKGSRKLVHGIEVRRYEADTGAKEGVVIAEVRDRLARFLTPGDVDGDGRTELVLAAFSSGLWLLRPGDDPMEPWTVTSIDRDSGGFEHASLLTDLDGDGKDELYVASDKHKEVRRYVWNGERLVREVIYRRDPSRSVFTWNIMPVPVDLAPAP